MSPDDLPASQAWLQAVRPDAIAYALKHAFGRDGWDIRGHDDYVHDQRLAGGSPDFPQLAQKLAQLPTP